MTGLTSNESRILAALAATKSLQTTKTLREESTTCRQALWREGAMGYIIFIVLAWLTTPAFAVILYPLSFVVPAVSGSLAFGNKRAMEVIGGALAGIVAGFVSYAQAWVVDHFFETNHLVLWVIIAIWSLGAWRYTLYAYATVPAKLTVVAVMFWRFL